MSCRIVEQPSRNVLIVRHNDVRAGWEAWYLLRSDAHHDNVHCDQALERKHLRQAKERGAGVIDIGDVFCAMQGKFDKRADRRQLRKELRGEDYLDQLVEYNAGFYEEYAKSFLILAPGNHETAILKHHQTNLTERLAERLNARTGAAIKVGTYAGWVKFHFLVSETQRESLNLYRHHGYGGDAPVTKGTIQTNRMSVYLPDATFVWTGHTHNEWLFTIPRTRLSQAGVEYLDEQIHIKTPGYKEEFGVGEGWHIERGGPPKPAGAAWLRFFYEGRSVKYEVTRAK